MKEATYWKSSKTKCGRWRKDWEKNDEETDSSFCLVSICIIQIELKINEECLQSEISNVNYFCIGRCSIGFIMIGDR